MACNYVRVELTLGKYYKVESFGRVQVYQLIKVSKKGFNFLGENARCLLGTHLYPADYAHKNLPTKERTFAFKVPDFIKVIGETTEPINRATQLI